MNSHKSEKLYNPKNSIFVKLLELEDEVQKVYKDRDRRDILSGVKIHPSRMRALRNVMRAVKLIEYMARDHYSLMVNQTLNIASAMAMEYVLDQEEIDTVLYRCRSELRDVLEFIDEELPVDQKRFEDDCHWPLLYDGQRNFIARDSTE